MRIADSVDNLNLRLIFGRSFFTSCLVLYSRFISNGENKMSTVFKLCVLQKLGVLLEKITSFYLELNTIN